METADSFSAQCFDEVTFRNLFCRCLARHFQVRLVSFKDSVCEPTCLGELFQGNESKQHDSRVGL